MPIVWLRPTYSAGTLSGGATPPEGIPGNLWGASNSQYDQDYGGPPLYAPNNAYNVWQLMRPTYGEYQSVSGAPLSGTWPPPQDAAGIAEYHRQQRNWAPYWQFPRRVGNTPPNNKRAMWLYFDWEENPDTETITTINNITIYFIHKRAYDEPRRPCGYRIGFYENNQDFPDMPPDNFPNENRFNLVSITTGSGIFFPGEALANSYWYATTGKHVFTTEPTGGPFLLSKAKRYWVYISYHDVPGVTGANQGEHQVSKIWLGIDAILGGTPAPGTGGLEVATGYSG